MGRVLPQNFIRALLLAAALGFSPPVASPAHAVPEAIHMLVMIVDFNNQPAPSDIVYRDGTQISVPLDIAGAESVLFTSPVSMAARYSEMSNGELTVTGEAIDVSIALNIGSATFDQWRLAANAAAEAQGKTLANYDLLGYLIARGFSGQTIIGGASEPEGWLWASAPSEMVSFVNEQTFNHEFGHTLSFPHAAELLTSGFISEYGDDADFMGSGDAVHTSAPNKVARGWLIGSRHQTHTLDATTTYQLRGLADTADALQVVTVDRHGSHPDLGAPIDTYLSFRRPINFDQNLSNASDSFATPIRNTVHVHHRRKDGRFLTYFERALDVGDIYTTGLMTVEFISRTGTRARVEVTQAAYFPGAPIVSAAAVGSNQVFSGTRVDYDLSVTNTDAPGIPFPSYFEASFVAPGPGWTVAWDIVPKEIVVAQGATELVTGLRITSPIGEVPGIYNIALTLTNETGSAGPVATLVNIPYEVLASPDNTPPPAPTALVGTAFPGTGDDYIVLQWTEPADTSDIHVYQTYRNGVALPTPAMREAFYLDFFYDGLESNYYIVKSVDAAGNESTPSSTLEAGVPDVVAPNSVTNLTGVDVGGEADLSWDVGVDDVWVAYYEVHRDGLLLDTTYDTSFVDTSTPAGPATYTVYAVDGAGNVSLVSSAFVFGPAVPALPLMGGGALAIALLGLGARRLTTRRTSSA